MQVFISSMICSCYYFAPKNDGGQAKKKKIKTEMERLYME